jgi:hypothetical protein
VRQRRAGQDEPQGQRTPPFATARRARARRSLDAASDRAPPATARRSRGRPRGRPGPLRPAPGGRRGSSWAETTRWGATSSPTGSGGHGSGTRRGPRANPMSGR